MGACKYGVSLRYLQATMHYIVYHTNTLALQWQHKSRLYEWMKLIEESTIAQCIGVKVQDGKMSWIMVTKQQWALFSIYKILIYRLCSYRQKKSFWLFITLTQTPFGRNYLHEYKTHFQSLFSLKKLFLYLKISVHIYIE